MEVPKVSIVICTHRRPELLRIVLGSLTHQDAQQNAFEVIVVDNDFQPNRQVQDMVIQFAKGLPLRYVHEPKVGLSYARNSGGKAAQAGYICYIDDDTCIPSQYVKVLVQVIERVCPHICGGPYQPFYLDPKPAWFKDAYGSHGFGAIGRFLGPDEYLSGMNITLNKHVLEKLDWFSPQYGMTGDRLGYGEETDLQIRAWKLIPDLKVYNDPNLCLYHLVPKRKFSLLWQSKSAFSMGFTQGLLWPTGGLEQANSIFLILLIIHSTVKIVYEATLKTIFRNRRQYPVWQNYYYEAVAPNFSSGGLILRILSDRHMFLKQTLWPSNT